MRERLMRDLRPSGGFGGQFARLEVWRDALQNRKDEWIARCGENVFFSFWINQDTIVDVDEFRDQMVDILATTKKTFG